MNKPIYLCLAHMGGHEQKFIQEAFDTNWVVPLGPNVDAFEIALSSYLSPANNGENNGTNDLKIVALSSGTAAIHLALLQLGVGTGDEVICQSFTFCATANPIAYLGATPVFVDSETDTWNMSPQLLEEAIVDRIAKTGKKPKAIVPVHLYGMPAKMDEIEAIAKKYEIAIVEDAAEALGSVYKGKRCGTFGQFGVLSFNGNKMITTSGGGALVCHHETDSNKTKFYATQARENFAHYQHEEIGYNYRMSNICAGIGRGQMMILEEHVEHHKKVNELYRKAFEKVEGITVMGNPNPDFDANFWLTTIQIDEEKWGENYESMSNRLAQHKIESRPLWKPLHLQPVFANAPRYVDGTAENLFNHGLCLPSGPCVTEEEVEMIVEIIKNK